MKRIFSIVTAMFLCLSYPALCSCIDLQGVWTIKLDPGDKGIIENWQGRLYENNISLPGTTDDASLGNPDTLSLGLGQKQLSHPVRKNSYIGPAWYSKEFIVPACWKGKTVGLSLERVIWQSKVWIDGIELPGICESLVSPHRFDVTSLIRPGKKQIITVRIDNRKMYDISVGNLAHSYTDQTQIIWNGMIGSLCLRPYDKVRIENTGIFTEDISDKKVRVKLNLVNENKRGKKCRISLHAVSNDGNHDFPFMEKNINVKPGVSSLEMEYTMGKEALLWDEFSPNLYKLEIKLEGRGFSSESSVNFGLRVITHEGNKLEINGRPLFLRGTLESCIFPLEGYPPMTKYGWMKVFSTARQWGLNHLRFHSWCPPEVAFEVADEMGMYLQIELPVWTITLENTEQPKKFLIEEGRRIITEYGNHPSFCLWSMGNELQKDFSVISEIMSSLKSIDNRHLYTSTSYTFEKGHGGWPEKDDDYFITQSTDKGWVRGQGIFNQVPPGFDTDYGKSVDSLPVPLITHEVGQYSVYPDLKEIEKYTGALKPVNFMSIREDLKNKGMLEKAGEYTMASGKFASILYKEEIERALKTPGISGFQLLDLHDYPGQGTATVGMLDAFWDSKGIMQPCEFREFCSAVVPLLRFRKATYFNDENFDADAEISNFSDKSIENCRLFWKVSDGASIIGEGHFNPGNIGIGLNASIGEIHFPLNAISKARKIEIELGISGTDWKNHWNFWVYPREQKIDFGKVSYTRNYKEALSLLKQGKTVLFNPDWKFIKGIEGKFVPVFWSPVHFPKQAGTMGILCNPAHKALSLFPTGSHSDWQWWDLNINSTTIVIDSLKGVTPIVEVIDNFANNRRLASLLEGNYAKGKFILATFDLSSDIDNRPAARQMLISLLNYMNSIDFNPSGNVNFELIESMIDSEGKAGKESATGIY